jgi:hypothetical protein
LRIWEGMTNGPGTEYEDMKTYEGRPLSSND